MPYKDLKKRRAYRREWYAKNKKSEKAHILRRKKEIRTWFEKYKSKLKCSKCYEDHIATLDFHHNMGKKEMNITKLVYEGYSIKRIKKEIEKCIILCANCHRKEHYKKK
jgi:hypothetical protein